MLIHKGVTTMFGCARVTSGEFRWVRVYMGGGIEYACMARVTSGEFRWVP